MRVLIFHGYLLRGTGSNVYNARLAAALLELGHEVHLLCQEPHPEELGFVGTVGTWQRDELQLERVRPGGCTIYRPDIGGLLPVYVPDRYEGVEARAFPELTDDELDAYLVANVRAVADVAARARPDVALANHLVMGPVILARALAPAGVPYAAKIHGSALEYTVKPHPRFLPFAREGVARANALLVGSRHTAESLWAALDDPSIPPRTRLGPPGVDVEAFRRVPRRQALERVDALATRLGKARGSAGNTESAFNESAFSRDDAAAAGALEAIAATAREDRLVCFVGKLIVAKGIDLLISAWPLVLAEVPEARLAVVGFGAFRGGVERLVAALSAGDLDAVAELAEQGRAAEGGPRSTLVYVLAFLESLVDSAERSRYLAAATRMRERVVLTGRLEHEELADLLPLCEALVVPSTFPEAFGMVAVEAAACGVLPISAAHSGLAEVSRALGRNLPASCAELLSFPLGPESVREIARRIVSWLRTPGDQAQAVSGALAETAMARYSWEGVAHGVLAAARGELDTLDPPA